MIVGKIQTQKIKDININRPSLMKPTNKHIMLKALFI